LIVILITRAVFYMGINAISSCQSPVTSEIVNHFFGHESDSRKQRYGNYCTLPLEKNINVKCKVLPKP